MYTIMASPTFPHLVCSLLLPPLRHPAPTRRDPFQPWGSQGGHCSYLLFDKLQWQPPSRSLQEKPWLVSEAAKWSSQRAQPCGLKTEEPGNWADNKWSLRWQIYICKWEGSQIKGSHLTGHSLDKNPSTLSKVSNCTSFSHCPLINRIA